MLKSLLSAANCGGRCVPQMLQWGHSHARRTRHVVVNSWLNLMLALGLLPLMATAQFTDTLPPTLVEFSLNPTTVNVTDGPAEVTVTLRVTDDLSGANPTEGPSYQQGWYVYAYSESWQQYVVVNGWQFSRVAGDDMDGTWQATLTIPQAAEPGTWRISGLYLNDRVGNSVYLYETDLTGLGFSPSFVVESTPDVTPPEIVSLTVDPAQIDTSTAGQQVTITAEMTDDVTGVATPEPPNYNQTFWMVAHWQAADGYQIDHYIWQFDLISGTPQNGIWQAVLFFPQYSQKGSWKLTFNGNDRAGNRFSYDSDFLQGKGLPSEIQVESDPSDTQPPNLASFSLTPVTIDTSGEDKPVTANLHTTDDLSGIAYAWAYLQSPSGGQYRWLYVPGGQASNPLDADLDGQTVFPRYSEAGTWHVEYVYAYDRVDNWRIWLRPELEGLGFGTSLNVILPSLEIDGTVDPATGGTVQDAVFGERAQVEIPPGILTGTTTVAIDVLEDPLDVETPTGFAGEETKYVNIHLEPQPDYPLAPPGLTVVLPLLRQLPVGTVLHLFRVDPATGQLEPAIDVHGNPVEGTVDVSGLSATFTGISRLSTIVALLADAVVTWPPPSAIEYGTPLSATQLNAAANMEGTYEYSPAIGSVLHAGWSQLLSVTFTPADSLYRAVTKTVNIDVTAAPLKITAQDKSKAFGASLPGLTAIYEGFVNGDGPGSLATPVALTTTATAFSPVGTYTINASGASGANYSIAFVAGKLTVTAPGTVQMLVKPGQVTQSAQTSVTFQMYVPPNATLLPASPNLQRLNGATWALLGTMYDDGTHGDLVAGDSTYSLAVVLNEARLGTVSFRGSVAYKGSIKRTFSNQAGVSVVGPN